MRQSLFHVYHVQGSCSVCRLFEEYKGYSKVAFICTDIAKLTKETASVIRGDEHFMHCGCGQDDASKSKKVKRRYLLLPQMVLVDLKMFETSQDPQT
jgi:hypothetical protein